MNESEMDRYMWLEGATSLTVNFDAYCLSIVTDALLSNVIEKLPIARSWDGLNYNQFISQNDSSERPVVGAFQAGRSVILYEDSGSMGVSPSFMAPLSIGRESVSHYVGGHGVRKFMWYVDGTLKTLFEPPFADTGEGEDPDALMPYLREIGSFVVNEEDEIPLLLTAPTFLLAEKLTSVRIEEALLLDASYFVFEARV